MRVSFMASSVKVTPKQFPDLHAKLQIACTTLGVEMPDLFVQQNPVVNAFTFGSEKHIIVLHSALIERLNDEETLAVISHEVGHIHAEHVLYLTAARIIEQLMRVPISMIPGADIVKFLLTASISSALLAWARRAELSCDRAALSRPARHRQSDDETGGRHDGFKNGLRTIFRAGQRISKELRRKNA